LLCERYLGEKPHGKHSGALLQMNLRGFRIYFLFGMLLPFVLSGSHGQEVDVLAGRVIAVSGDAFAVDVINNSRRNLSRRSEIYVRDVIETGDRSSIQLRMVDSGLISLQCNSQLKIEAYEFNDEREDLIVLRLLRGTLRTITGKVGQMGRDQYNFHVGDTQLKIRGTDFEVSIAESGVVYFGTYDGGTTLVNAFGEVDLGVGADQDFAIVEPGKAPRGTLLQPPQLGALANAAPNCF